MKTLIFIMYCLVFCNTSYSLGANDNTREKRLSKTEIQLDTDKAAVDSTLTQLKQILEKSAVNPSEDHHKKSSKLSSEPKHKTFEKIGSSITADNITAADLLEKFSNMSKNKHNKIGVENETTERLPYEVKHYLTPEQKYYMLRINLLGIGIRVVHDIVPIPVTNVDQYTNTMEAILDKIQEARKQAANISSSKMQNITLKDAHELQMKMNPEQEVSSEIPATAEKKTSYHVTEVLILIGVIAGILVIGGVIWLCKRSEDAKHDPYYDHMQSGGGSGMPMN